MFIPTSCIDEYSHMLCMVSHGARPSPLPDHHNLRSVGYTRYRTTIVGDASRGEELALVPRSANWK